MALTKTSLRTIAPACRHPLELTVALLVEMHRTKDALKLLACLLSRVHGARQQHLFFGLARLYAKHGLNKDALVSKLPSLCTSWITGFCVAVLWISIFSRVPSGISHTNESSGTPCSSSPSVNGMSCHGLMTAEPSLSCGSRTRVSAGSAAQQYGSAGAISRTQTARVAGWRTRAEGLAEELAAMKEKERAAKLALIKKVCLRLLRSYEGKAFFGTGGSETEMSMGLAGDRRALQWAGGVEEPLIELSQLVVPFVQLFQVSLQRSEISQVTFPLSNRFALHQIVHKNLQASTHADPCA